FRNREIGFVFQDHYLLPQCSVLENVLTPTLVAPPSKGYEEQARQLLERVGLTDRIHHRPGELSGGEKQRVAIARALMRRPRLLLCDEPTGNLDCRSAETVASLLLDLQAREERILIVVTHNSELAGQFPLHFELTDGKLEPAESKG
ncbi:MAG: ABC transporter ATP-binding protein, partial [Acidobacteriota bacterium]